MLKFIFKRLLQSFLVLICIMTITFFLVKLAPGGPFDAEKAFPEHIKAKLESYYWLNRPMPMQLGRHFYNFFVQLDGGPSISSPNRSVGEIIGEAFPISAQIGIGGLLIAMVIGIPIGLISAARKNSATDYTLMSLALVGICLPTFVIGPIFAVVLGINLDWGSTAGWWDPRVDWFLPSLTLGLFYTGYFARLTRGGMLDSLSQDYIRTARAKGMPEWRVVVVHALKGGLLPAITFIGPAIAGIIGGSFIVEQIFHVPGQGRIFINATLNRDDPLIIGTVLLFGALILVMNLLVDIVQVFLNPRLRDTSSEAS